MMGCLLIGIGKLDHVAIIVRTAQEGYSGRQVVASESCRHDDGRHENEKRVDMRRTFLVDKRRIDTVLDEGRLMFHRFVHKRVEFLISHGLEKVGRQFFSRQEILIVGIRSRGPCPALP